MRANARHAEYYLGSLQYQNKFPRRFRAWWGYGSSKWIVETETTENRWSPQRRCPRTVKLHNKIAKPIEPFLRMKRWALFQSKLNGELANVSDHAYLKPSLSRRLVAAGTGLSRVSKGIGLLSGIQLSNYVFYGYILRLSCRGYFFSGASLTYVSSYRCIKVVQS